LAKKGKKKSAPGSGASRSATQIGLRLAADQRSWELVHPRCAAQRREDMQEVDAMLRAGEVEIAVDELRWLLAGCPDFIDAHCALGELALAEGDLALARGHFGHGFRIGDKAIHKAGDPRPVPYERPANQSFFQCGKGLVHCLVTLNKKKMAREVIARLLACDESDPLNVRALGDAQPD
jgi:hypothetical protein